MNVTEAVEIAKTVQGWMRREELTWLYNLARIQKHGAHWVEVGSWKGRSLIATALGLPDGTNLDSIESLTGSEESGGTHLETTFPIPWIRRHLELSIELIMALNPDVNIRSFLMPSTEAARTRLDETLDVVFIDAAHNEKAVTEDVSAWYPKVKPGGIICGHDRCYKGVKAALRKTVKQWKEGAGSIWWRKK